MGKITYPDKIAGSQYSGAEATEVKNIVNANDDAATLNVEVATITIKADKKRTDSTPTTMSGDLTLTWDATGAVVGSGETKMIIGDGNNVIISGATLFPDNGNIFPTVAGQEYLFIFVWQGAYLQMDVSPEITATETIILLEDDFAGTTIDTAKWTVTDPADGVTISQNDALLFTTTGGALLSWTLNGLTHKTVIIPINTACVAIDFVSITSGDLKDRGIRLKSNAGLTHIGLRTRFNIAWETSLFVTDSTGTSLQGSGDNLIDLDLTGKSTRLRLESGTIYAEYWNVSTWTEIDSVAIANVDADTEFHVNCGDNGSDSAGVVTFDNAYITNDSYSTQYPT